MQKIEYFYSEITFDLSKINKIRTLIYAWAGKHIAILFDNNSLGHLRDLQRSFPSCDGKEQVSKVFVQDPL